MVSVSSKIPAFNGVSARLSSKKFPVFHCPYADRQLIIAFITFRIVRCLPEPSQWVVKHVCEEETLHVLCGLRRIKYVPHSEIKDRSGDDQIEGIRASADTPHCLTEGKRPFAA